MKKNWLVILIVLSSLGLFDALYLSWEHISDTLPPCSVHWWVDCGSVLQSSYAVWWGIPVAVLGVAHYSFLLTLAFILRKMKHQATKHLLFLQTVIGALFSLYFVFLQLFIIKAICVYCMGSALINLLLLGLTTNNNQDKKQLLFWIISLFYKGVKHIFFLFNAEHVHELIVRLGETLGQNTVIKKYLSFFFKPKYPLLSQSLAGLQFDTPVGLAAGFDYEARLTQILPSVGFGFQTVGTITNTECSGNARPRLGRLPKSKALLVNKGFRNPGAPKTIKKLSKLFFTNPVGVSIGQTNNKNFNSIQEVIADIISCFTQFEKSSVSHQYYELNISCPNLNTNYTFYSPKNLELLLRAVDNLKLLHPVFIKMPISESDDVIIKLLAVIATHSLVGIIIGNLQKNRHDPAVAKSERVNLGKGNLSGKPTFERSNHLIALAYKKYAKRFIIIGCGGVFSGKDAELKIRLGATLIQLITGLVFQGPHLVAEINYYLNTVVKKEKLHSISQLVGSLNKV